MCVAVVVESPKQLKPSDIKAMADANPHGGGVAWIDGDLIQYRKGLDWTEIAWMQDHLPRPFFMHFRIATRGEKIPELTHPFPVGMDSFVGDLTGLARAVVMHNGTWSRYGSYVPHGINREAVSDTQVAAYVAGFDETILDEVGWSNAIMRAAGNGRADLTLRGQWTEYEGNLFSNMHWQSRWDWDRWYQGRNTRSVATMALERANSKSEKLARKAAKRARREERKRQKASQMDLVDLLAAADRGDFSATDWDEIDSMIRDGGIKI